MGIKSKKAITISIVIILSLIFFPELFAILAYPDMKVQSENEIRNFVGTIDQNSTSYEKIEKIMVFVVQDYYQTYGNVPTLYLDPLKRFQVYGDLPTSRSERPHIRLNCLFLSEDPYRIAYYKTGACGELAILFNKVATEANLNSRMVKTSAEDHMWNEVYLDGRWVHVDPTLYYHYSKGILEYEKLWFDHPSAYSELGWYGGYSKVFVHGTKLDVSSKYFNISNISVNFLEPADRIRVKPIAGNRYSFEDTIEGFQYSFDIGCKEYSITAEKDVIPSFLVMQDTCNFTAVDNATIQVELSPHTVKPTALLQFIFLMIVVLGSGYSIGILLRNSKKNS